MVSNGTSPRPTIFLPPTPPSGSLQAFPQTEEDGTPQDSVTLSGDAMAYIDPDEAWKAGSNAGAATGTVLGGAVGTAGAVLSGQPEAAIITGPAGMGVGCAGGYYVGGAIASGAAHAANAVERVVNWVTGR